jgi:hypothetical protein
VQDHLVELVEGAVQDAGLEGVDAGPGIDPVQLVPVHEEVSDDASEALQRLRSLRVLLADQLLVADDLSVLHREPPADRERGDGGRCGRSMVSPQVGLLHGDLLDGLDETHLPGQRELVLEAVSDLSEGEQRRKGNWEGPAR